MLVSHKVYRVNPIQKSVPECCRWEAYFSAGETNET